MELLAINHSLSERRVSSSINEVLPMFWLFCNLHGLHFPTIELDNMIRFSTLSRMSGFLWHSAKWASQFGGFLQYMSGLEVLACSFNTSVPTTPFLESLSKVAATYRGEIWQPFSCILIDGYVSTAGLSWTLGPLLNFPAKCINF